MRRKTRQFFFIIFAVLFAASIPFVLLYTAGYSYNSKKNKFEKTGSLVVNTITKDTMLYIDNGKPNYDREEFRIKNLLPGEYDIKITKENYFDWEKKLEIQSELTTFVKDLRLWKKNLPVNLASGMAGAIYPSHDSNRFAYAGADSLFIFDVSSREIKKIMNWRETVKNISWSADNAEFLLESAGGFKVIDPEKGDASPNFFKNKIYAARWDEKTGSDLYASTEDGVYKINLIFQSALKIYSARLNDFWVTSDYIYFISGSAIKQIDLKTNETVSIPLERTGYKIRSAENGKIFLTGNSGKMQIFNLPLETRSVPVLIANAKDFDIRGNGLLYYNDYEIWTYNFETGAKDLITRLGAEIKKARWTPDASNILFILENQLKIIELDKRGGRQTFDLAKFSKINDFILTKKYEIFFSGRINAEGGIYGLEI